MDQHKPDHEWEVITPEVAAELLARNDNNRLLKPDSVQKYARSMELGDWGLTGQPIIIDTNGNLVDGQHRLHAVVKAGQSIEFLVVRGVRPEVMPVIDRGKSRDAKDALRWAGQKHVVMAASAVRTIIALEQRLNLRDSHQTTVITDTEILERSIELQPIIEWLAPLTHHVNEGAKLPPSGFLAATIWLVLQDCDPTSVEQFAKQISTGAGLEEGSPILALRTWSFNNLVARKRYRPAEVLCAVLKTWNDVAEGNKRKMMRISSSEPIPAVIAF